MHLYVIARGERLWLERWQSDLSAQYFEYISGVEQNIKGAKVKNQVQLAVRPVQLFEIVFPEPCLQEVLQTVRPLQFHSTQQSMRFLSNKLRQSLKLDPIPEYDKTRQIRVMNPFVSVHVIGLKKDPRNEIEML